MAEPITSLLAVYGAALSSIAFGWNLCRDLGDRARLQIVANLRQIAPVLGTGRIAAVSPSMRVVGKSDQLFVCIEVTNIGRRPVRWNGWGGDYRTAVSGKTSFTIIGRELPKMLKEGESHTEFTPELHDKIDNVKRITVWDASGKKWCLPRRALRKLKQDIQLEIKVRGAAAGM